MRGFCRALTDPPSARACEIQTAPTLRFRQPAPSSFNPIRQNHNWGTSTHPCPRPLPESAMPETCDRRRRPVRLCPPLSLLLPSRGTGREQVLNRPFSHQQFPHPTACHRPSAAACRRARRTGPQQGRNRCGTGSPRTNDWFARTTAGPDERRARARREPALAPSRGPAPHNAPSAPPRLAQRLGEGNVGPAAGSDPLAQFLGEGAGGEGQSGTGGPGTTNLLHRRSAIRTGIGGNLNERTTVSACRRADFRECETRRRTLLVTQRGRGIDRPAVNRETGREGG
jgi:hypothetical protein